MEPVSGECCPPVSGDDLPEVLPPKQLGAAANDLSVADGEEREVSRVSWGLAVQFRRRISPAWV